jgi:hypothetical protein
MGDRQGANVSIGICLASEQMIRDVESVMLRLGIVGSVRTKPSRYDKSGRVFPAWTWTVSRVEDMKRFQDLVGILGKDDRVAEAVRAKESFGGRAAKWMRAKVPSGYRWERVVSIEALGPRPTVCVSVPGKQTYVTTFVEHNSHTVSRLACWWIDVHPPGEAFVVITAPTTAQVEAILWRYIGNAHRKAGLPGRITLDAKWYIGQELVAYGGKPADYDQAAFQGIHAPTYWSSSTRPAGCRSQSSMPSTLWQPTSRPEWWRSGTGRSRLPLRHHLQAGIRLGGEEDQRLRHSRLHRGGSSGRAAPPAGVSGVVEERKVRWGVNSPIYQSKVLGEFPDLCDDTLILPKWIEAAQKRVIERNRRPRIAWDNARFGEDETVGMRREGGRIRLCRAHHKADTMTTTGHIAKAMRDIDAEADKNDFVTAVVDVVGVGAGVYDRVVELGLPVTPPQRWRGTVRQGAVRQRSSGGLLELAGDLRERRDRYRRARRQTGRSARVDQVGCRLPGTDQNRVQGRHAESAGCRHRIGPTVLP